MKKLSQLQREVLEEIAASGIAEGFYLAGGTGISIKYDHRYSEDFDFFCFPYKNIDFFKLSSCFLQKQVLELSKDTLIILLKGVKVSFFEYNYPLINEPYFYKDLSIKIASDEDIAAMKAIAIMQRGEKKDFFDLWYLMKYNQWSLEDILSLCKKKYLDSFNEYVFIKSIVYFEDAEKSKIKDIDPFWKEIKYFFNSMVKDFYF
ncbi:nucleotidyl transferase AbiEii/AbiGii toxin family protein [Desulfothermus okinawensis JCM 13304]